MRAVRVLLCAPPDVEFERRRFQRVAARLNGEFTGLVRIETIGGPASFDRGQLTPERCISTATACDIVVGVFWSRLDDNVSAGPAAVAQSDGYGPADAILTGIEARGDGTSPAVFVFRKLGRPQVPIDDAAEFARARQRWTRLQAFFERALAAPGDHSRAGVVNFETIDEFEGKLETVLRGWITDHLAHARGRTWSIALKGSPFPGLASFEAEHAPVFFGRSRETGEAIDRLKAAAARQTAFLLVCGGSGAGKSSLVRAGLVPRLTSPGVVPDVDGWRLVLMRPGARPIEALAHALLTQRSEIAPAALPELAHGDSNPAAHIAGLLRREDEAAVRAITQALAAIGSGEQKGEGLERPWRASLLLVVDELDDLFAEDVSADDRAVFCRLMRMLATSGAVWIVATLRAALHEVLLGQGDLAVLKESGAEYDLRSPGAAELSDIVRRPAAAAGLAFENQDEALDARLLRDAGATASLPLLQFTLQRLFAQRQLVDSERRLTHAAYDVLGGIAGAIDHVAEHAMAELGKAEVEALPRLLRSLVAPTHGSPAVPGAAPLAIRSVMLAELDAPRRRLVDALVDARILVHSIERGVPMIRLAHLAVLEHWQRARTMVAAELGVIRPAAARRQGRWRGRLSAAAAALLAALGVLGGWNYFEARQAQQAAEQSERTALAKRDRAEQRRGMAERRLHEALELRQLAEVRQQQALQRAQGAEAGQQQAQERAQVAEAGQQRALEQARRAETGQRQAQERAQLAESRHAAAERARGLAQQQHEAARSLAREERGRAFVVQARLLAELADQNYRAGDQVTAVLLALEALPDDSDSDPALVVEARRILERAWRTQDGDRIPREKWILGGASAPVLACALGRNGSRAAVGSADGTVQVWDAETGTAALRLDGHSEDLTHLSFGADATKIVSAAADGLRVRDATTGAPIASLPEKRAVLAVSADAQWVISSSAPDRLHLWDTTTGRESTRTLPGSVLAVHFGAEGARLLVAGAGGSITLFDAISGRRLRTFRGHARRVLNAAFSPDGQRIASLGEDQTARVWSAANGRQLFSVFDQRLKPTLAVRLTSEHVLIPFAFGSRLYGINDARLISQFSVDEEISIALISPDGKYVITAASAAGVSRAPGGAWLWDAVSAMPLAILEWQAAISCASFSQDGRTLLTGGRDGPGRIWSFERTASAPSAATPAAMIEFSQTQVPRCLTRGQRESASLAIEPPAWCVEKAKWPYQTQAWKDWLRYKRENARPPLPDTPEWRAWLAYRASTSP